MSRLTRLARFGHLLQVKNSNWFEVKANVSKINLHISISKTKHIDIERGHFNECEFVNSKSVNSVYLWRFNVVGMKICNTARRCQGNHMQKEID